MLKAISVALTAGCAYLASAGAASAEPISIGSFIISAMMSGGLGAIIPTVSAALIGNVVLGAAVVGSMLVQSALMRTPSIQPEKFKNVFRGDNDTSEIRAIGRVRVGGLAAFGNTKGRDRYRLICHTRGPWTATEEHYLGGREITVEDDGSVSSPPYAKPDGSWVYVRSKIGDGTETAWPDLLSAFPTLWSVDHRMRGIHQSLVKYSSPGLESQSGSAKHMKMYQGGEPAYEKVGRAEPVYDPREGAQSATAPETWEWRENAIINAAHILRSFPSLKASDLDYAHMASEATKADAMVPAKGGTEQRARAWGVWTSESARGDIMDQVLRSIGAEIVQTSDNLYTIRLIEDDPAPEIQIPARHVIDIDYASGPESVQRPNVCRVKYYCPERNFDFADIDLTGIAWARQQDEIDRVGEQVETIELPFCPSAAQAQRIARRLFALRRADAGVMRLNYAGVAAWGMTIALLPFPDVGNDGGIVWKKCAIGSPRINDDEGKVDLPFVVWPELPPWNPATMEAAAPEPIPDLQFPSDIPTPVEPVEYAQVEYPDTTRELRIKFTMPTYPPPEPGDPTPGPINLAEASRRSYAGALPNAWASMAEYRAGSTTTWHAWAAVNWQGLDADFRVRFFNTDDEGSNWSPYLEARPVAAPNNTPTAAPSLSLRMEQTTLPGDIIQYTLYADITPSELRAAQVSANGNYANCRPDQVTSIVVYDEIGPPEEPIDVTARSYTSDGTPGATVVETYNP